METLENIPWAREWKSRHEMNTKLKNDKDNLKRDLIEGKARLNDLENELLGIIISYDLISVLHIWSFLRIL